MKRFAKVLVATSLLMALPGCNSTEKQTAASDARVQDSRPVWFGDPDPITTPPPPVAKAEPAPAPAPPPPAPEKPLSVQETVEVSVTAKVKAIAYGGRTVTLEDAHGNEIKFGVDEHVQRLNQVLVGDNVHARYRATLLAELRAPTAEESAHPISAVDVEGRTPQGSTPAGTVGQIVKVVTTVEAVDLPNMLVTLRGPMGDLAVVRGKKPENVAKLHVGDTIVITYTQSVALALEKVAPR